MTINYISTSTILRYDTIRYGTTRHDTTRHDTTRHDTTRKSTQRNATQRNATQRNATQRNASNATQRNATQRNATQRNAIRWVYTSVAVKRFDTLSRASQMRMKALAVYLFILFTRASARVNPRQKAWLGARCYTVQQC